MPLKFGKTLSETFLERVHSTPSLVGFQYKPTHPEMGPVGVWKRVTFREFHDECRLVSMGLASLGVRPGQTVAILSNTRIEWSMADMAILAMRAVTVPIYASNTSQDVAYILNNSEAQIAFVENSAQLEKLLQKKSDIPALKAIISFEPDTLKAALSGLSLLSFQSLKELGKRELAKEPSRFERSIRESTSQDLFTICYTSGTTGIPKGVMLSHENMISVLEDSMKFIRSYLSPERHVLLAMLPFTHILGRVESMIIYPTGWRECYAESQDKWMSNFMEIQPTIVFAVPRIFEKAYERINGVIEGGSSVGKKLFQWAFKTGETYFSSFSNQEAPKLLDFAQYQLAKQTILKKIRDRLGGRLSIAICGGAPLSPELGEFFQIIGVKILEGYGLTETCAPVTLNPPTDPRYGTVGKPLGDVSIKIAEDGEILIQSKKVFKGYLKMPQETEAALSEGWLHTGDVGYLDSDCYLHITDRKKDIIITSGGKNIAPQKIENLATNQKYISQFIVHGDRRNYLTALVTLDQDQVIQFAQENQILFSSYSELIKNPKIIGMIQRQIDEVNSQLASYETIKKFVILPHVFSVESGELTPSMKIKRSWVSRKYEEVLDTMYSA